VSIVPLGMKANKNFLPDEDESQFGITLRAPEGTSLDATRIIATRVAAEHRGAARRVVRRHHDRRRRRRRRPTSPPST
jgi:multidrug efflux pump subunit AcrB